MPFGVPAFFVSRIRDTVPIMQTISRTAAATQARMRTSESKLARKLIERGWWCARTGTSELKFDPRRPSPGLQVYATNSLGETYRVVGWTGAGEPILSGRVDNQDFVGVFDYIFTIGPAL